MRIHLLCDQKWRDLPNLAAIKISLESRGHRVLLSTTKNAVPMVKAFRPDCVVFNHLFAPSNQKFAASLREGGVAVVVLPTEGAVRPELRPIGDGEFAQDWPMDLHLAWSEPAARDIRARWGLDESVVPVLGCTRLDFYAPQFRAAITYRDDFCRRYELDPSRPIVTWATAYAYAEVKGNAALHAKFLSETAGNGLAECYRRIGLDPARVAELHASGREACARDFATLVSARPDVQFIIRPHPAENRDFYRALIAERGLNNVRFCPQDYIWNVLNASDVHLHRHCTTAIEAWMWDKPTIEMGMDHVPELAWPDREAGSETASTSDELIAAVDRALRPGMVDGHRRAYRRSYIKTWFGPTDGKRCCAAADVIDRLLTARGKRRRFLTPLPKLEASPRQIAGAVARHILGLRPNERFWSGAPTALLDPHDKQVTQRDLRNYEGRIRNAVL
jgi:surface carbohydrate biosynthesis protein